MGTTSDEGRAPLVNAPGKLPPFVYPGPLGPLRTPRSLRRRLCPPVLFLGYLYMTRRRPTGRGSYHHRPPLAPGGTVTRRRSRVHISSGTPQDRVGALEPTHSPEGKEPGTQKQSGRAGLRTFRKGERILEVGRRRTAHPIVGCVRGPPPSPESLLVLRVPHSL